MGIVAEATRRGGRKAAATMGTIVGVLVTLVAGGVMISGILTGGAVWIVAAAVTVTVGGAGYTGYEAAQAAKGIDIGLTGRDAALMYCDCRNIVP